MWTYLKHHDEGGLLASEAGKLPPRETVFLAFDAYRWKVQLGIRESGGYMSLLLPQINDDCMILAWAPLAVAHDPSESELRAHCVEPWHQAINANYAKDGLTLIRAHNEH